MVKILDLYQLSDESWNNIFILSKNCDEEIFHKSIYENSWSVEKILRHLILSLTMINNNALLTEKLSSDLTFQYTENPDDRISLEEIMVEYKRISKIIKEGMKKIDEKHGKENIKLGQQEIPRDYYLIRMFAHEQEHFGQIMWILKRETKWTANDVFEIIEKSQQPKSEN